MAVERFIPGESQEFLELLPEELMTEESAEDCLYYGQTLKAGEAGVLVIAPRGRKAVLRWILVREDLRRQGVGTDLLLDVMLRLREAGFPSLSFQVIPGEAPDLMGLAERFSMEKTETEQSFVTMKLSDAEKLGKVKGDRKEIYSLKTLSKEDRIIARERLDRDFPERASRPFKAEDLEPELTLFKFDDAGLCAGLFVEETEGRLYLAYLFNDNPESLAVEGLLSTAYEKAAEKYPGATPLSVAVLDERTAELLSGIPSLEKETAVELTMDLTILDLLMEDDESAA